VKKFVAFALSRISGSDALATRLATLMGAELADVKHAAAVLADVLPRLEAFDLRSVVTALLGTLGDKTSRTAGVLEDRFGIKSEQSSEAAAFIKGIMEEWHASSPSP